MRERLTKAMKEAMVSKDATRLSTIRLINAAIKDRDIAARTGDGSDNGVSDAEILGILGRMIKQRQESARLYEEGGRLELAEQERSEIAVIEEFLPRRLDDAEVEAAVKQAVAQTQAHSIRDMGKVMGILKSQYAGQMDFAKAGAAVRAALG
ncbi:GatB/YqeY domain-containing protein [Paroceanicella profunda]|uniref:GatB/YqeY domain-containing protein n=1 Tax=Paroceanicella profunda TaxID=2579971 RepID=A0A5B8FHM1_9RHOB|nr:GatB/YqeY domain-containing protein [Paroceanicella profunda]QDL92601.1 GatB/YqeY domain-containing protein [Paroceanicella profunda]